MIQEKIFKELDLLISVKMSPIADNLTKLRGFLNDKQIPLTTQVTPTENLGVVLINILESLDTFLQNYTEIKETWCVTPPSPVLDDEK